MRLTKTLGCLPLLLVLTCMQPLAAQTPANQDAHIAAQASQRLNLNQATLEQLQALPGIGPSRAAAILALREQKGRFEQVEELQEIRGIGPSLTERLRDRVSF